MIYLKGFCNGKKWHQLLYLSYTRKRKRVYVYVKEAL